MHGLPTIAKIFQERIETVPLDGGRIIEGLGDFWILRVWFEKRGAIFDVSATDFICFIDDDGHEDVIHPPECRKL